jgi:hypothetical protein
MALFMDGADYYNSVAQQQSIWSSTSTGITPGVIGSGVYGYGRAINQANLNNLNKLFSEVENTPGANWQTIYMGFHFLCPTLPTGGVRYIAIMDGATFQLTLRVNAGFQFLLYRGDAVTLLGTSAQAMVGGTWYWVTIKAVISNNAGVGSFDMNVEGSGVSGSQISFAGDTATSANDYATQIRLNTSSVATNSPSYDNFHLYDGSDGAPFNAMLDERRIYFGLADGDGSDTAWTASAGARWQCQDENPPNDDTDYIHTAGVGNRNSVVIPDFVNVTPEAVKMSARTRRDDAGPSNVALFVKNAAATYSTGANVPTGSTYVYIPRTMLLSPFTLGAWGLAEVNGAEWGVQRTS